MASAKIAMKNIAASAAKATQPATGVPWKYCLRP